MGKRISILVVDDEAPLCELLRRTLEMEGYQVDVAYDGLAAFDRMKRGSFDLLIVDEAMPKITGTALLKILKEGGTKVPVIFITGLASEELKNSIRETADAFLAKPFSTDQLKAAVDAILKEDNGNKREKELVCTIFGLKFYASPKRARILKTKITDLLFSDLSNNRLTAMDVKPSIDFTPPFTRITAKRKREALGNQTDVPIKEKKA